MKHATNAEIRRYRPVRPGPEAWLDAAVLRSIGQLISKSAFPRWMAASLPVGAGMPDLLAISWNPRVIAIANQKADDASILAYLRAVGCARFDTIVSRLRRKADTVADSLDALVRASVLLREADRYSLDPAWRSILPEVIAIEAKVSDWRRALAQASRNQLFAHRSYVALPSTVAARVANAPELRKLGVGVLSVEGDGAVVVVRQAVPLRPRVWAYYYQLAHHIARDTSSTTQCPSSSQLSKQARSIRSTLLSIA